MFTKRFTRPAVFAWTLSSSPVQGLVVADCAQQFDPTGNSKLNFVPIDALYQRPDDVFESTVSVATTHRFNEIVVTAPQDAHLNGLCVGGGENGHVKVFDLRKFIEGSEIDVVASRRDHQGHVLSVSISQDQKWVLTGGGNGQLLLWDLANLQQPYSPGTPNFNDQVKVVRWNMFMQQVAASLSSHRCSLWDVRRPGAPTLELAEVGGGVDWTALCWSPTTDMQLVTASQADSVPLLALWDLRYPTAPVRESRPHSRGITALHWHGRDARLLISAGRDGDVQVTDPESATRLGALPAVHGDWVRAISAAESSPNLLALSLFQHPLQVVNFDSFGAANQTQVNGAGGTVELSVIPAWSSAPSAGARFGFGAKMVAVNKELDQHGRANYVVNITKVEQDPILTNEAQQLQNGIEPGNLATYCEDLANSADNREGQLVWSALMASVTGGARRDYIRLMGYELGENERNGTATSGVGTVVSKSADSSESEADEELRLPPLDFQHIGTDTWGLVDDLAKRDELSVVEKLVAKGDFATAFVVANSSDTDRNQLLDLVVKRYLQSNMSADKRLLSTIAVRRLQDYVDASPLADWRRTVSLIFAREGRNRVTQSLRRLIERGTNALKTERSEEARLRIALPSIFAGDPEHLLLANAHLPLDERIRQAVVLRHSIGGGSDGAVDLGPLYEANLLEYCNLLVSNGILDVAWRLLKNIETENKELLDLRLAVYEAIGGRNKLQTRPPPDPHAEEKAIYSELLGPKRSYPQAAYGQTYQQRQPTSGYRQPPMASSSFAPTPPAGYSSMPASTQFGYPPLPPTNQYVPPTSTFSSMPSTPPVGAPQANGFPTYAGAGGFSTVANVGPPPSGTITQQPAPQPSPLGNDWSRRGSLPYQPAQVAAPAMPALPPQTAPTSSSGGWNDPPPLAPKQPKQPKAPVVEVNWKPLETTQMPSTPNYPYNQYSQLNQQFQQQLHVAAPSPGAAAPAPSPFPAQVALAPEDQQLVDQLHRLADAIATTNKTTLTQRKVEEVKHRLDTELVPRLAQSKFTPTTRSLLSHVVGLSTQGDFRGAQRYTGELSKGADFVEISPVVHPLKTLFTLATSTWNR